MQTQFTRTQLTIFLTMVMVADLVMITVIAGTLASPRVGALVAIAGIGIPVLMFWGLIPLVAGLMGWFGLRRRYPGVGSPNYHGNTLMISPAFGRSWVGLNNVIEAEPDDEYLHMRVWAPFGGWRMPVSIPWAAIPEIEPFKKDRAILHLDGGPRVFVPLFIVRHELALRSQLSEAPVAP